METTKLTEGTYEIADGYEYVGMKNSKLVVKKVPDYKCLDIVAFSDGGLGVVKSCTCETGSFYIDFCYTTIHGKIDVLYVYTNRAAVNAKNMRQATEEEKAFFYDVIHAYGYDFNPKESFAPITYSYRPNEAKYGIAIRDNELKAVELVNVKPEETLGSTKWEFKFENERSAEICAQKMMKKIKIR